MIARLQLIAHELIASVRCALGRHVWRFVRSKRCIADESFDLCIECGAVRDPE